MMKEAGTVTFREVETSDEALAIVRYDDSSVALALSLKSNGDLEVVMLKQDARALFEALRIALE